VATQAPLLRHPRGTERDINKEKELGKNSTFISYFNMNENQRNRNCIGDEVLLNVSLRKKRRKGPKNCHPFAGFSKRNCQKKKKILEIRRGKCKAQGRTEVFRSYRIETWTWMDPLEVRVLTA